MPAQRGQGLLGVAILVSRLAAAWRAATGRLWALLEDFVAIW